jgi:hypothetical protein
VRYAVPRHVSVDDLAERLFPEADPLLPAATILQRVRDVAQEHAEAVLSLFARLPAVNRQICQFYFIDGMDQEGVSVLIDIGQSEVSNRLHSSIELLRFSLKRPTGNPNDLKKDLAELLPCRLVEPAHALYLNVATRRAADILGVSESTAGNLRKEVVTYLKRLVALPDRGPYDHDVIAGLGLGDPAGTILADDELIKRRELASRYLHDFSRAAGGERQVGAAIQKKRSGPGECSD